MMQIWRELLNSLVVSLKTQLGTPLCERRSRKRRRHSTTAIAPRLGNQAETLECRTLLTPFVSRIDRITPLTETTDSPTVTYRVEFDEDVTGVDIADFRVTTQGSVFVAAPLAITPESSSTYLVSIAGIGGSGELRLDLIDDDSINDSEGVLGGQGIGNGSFQGQSYLIRQTQPVVLTLERTLPAEQTTEATTVTFTITFDRPVTGVDSSDFELVTTGSVASAVPLSVTGTGAVYEITVSEISGVGSLGLKFEDDNTVRDANGNPLAPASHETIFAPSTVMGTSGTPNHVALGDLDRDGNLDLIAASRNQGNILVSMGNGDGTFQMEQAYSAGGGPRSIVVADVDGDGFLDVVSLNPDNNNVTILHGLGDGTFDAPYPLGETAEGFTSPNFYFLPGAMAVRDVSNDGTADILVTDSYDQSVNVSLGYGDGAFFNDGGASTGNDPSALKLEDVNRDGYIDLIVALRGSNQVQVLLKIPDLGFEVAGTYTVGQMPAALAVRDVNGDGWVDIITANEGDNTISVLLTDSMGVFGAAQSIEVGALPRNLEILDVNGDGRNDIVVSNQNSSTISVLNGLGGGAFLPATTFTVGGTPTNLAWGDIDGDGRIDLITGDIESNSVRILRNAAFGNLVGQTYEITAAPPEFTSPDHAEVDENFPVASVVLVVNATPSQPGFVTYYLSGPDQDLFTLDGETGAIRFNFPPDYESPSDLDSDNVYNITVTADGGNELSTDQNIAITVLPVNDNSPVIEPQPKVNVPENTLPSTVVLTALGNDADLPTQSLIYSLGGPDSSRFSIDPGTGQIRFLASPDFELPADDDQNNIYRITVSVADGGGNTATLDHLIEVTPVNDANPTITSSATAEIVEGQSAETIVLTVVATDSDLPAQSLSFSLVGSDSELFNIDSQTGVIRFNNSPSFSSPGDSDGDNVYRFNVIVADGNGGFTDQLTFITVTPSNTSPFFAAPSVDVSIDENWAVETFVLAAIAIDLDTPTQVLTYNLSGEDFGLFTIDPLSGEIRFVSSPDFELPVDADGDNIYRVTVIADDGNGGLATQDVVITVMPVNDNAPIITSSASVYIPETWSTSDGILTPTAIDGDVPTQTLTFSLTGVDADLFQIDSNTGEVRFLSVPDYENPDDEDGDGVYRLILQAFDGNGLSGIQDLEILVFPINDNPTVITSPDTVSIPENTSTETVVLAVTVTDADLPAEFFFYEIYEGDAEQFSIDPYSGQIRFLNSPDYENPIEIDGDNSYQFQVYIYGSSEQLTIQDVTILVLPVNESIPEITSGGTVSIAENTSSESMLLQVQAVDGDLPAESLTFTLSGADALLFNLDSVTGELRFVSSPDFELPQSATGDNIYRAVVTASDGTFSSMQELVVTVLPVNDNVPIFTSAGSVNFAENSNSNGVVLDVDGVDSDLPSVELNYTIAGADAAFFSIDSTSGEIRFLLSPDYEDPQSATGDNIYRAVVTVSDGTFMTSQDVVVTVLPVNDNAPVVTSSGSASVNENTSTSVVILDVNAADADLPSSSLNYSLVGTDADAFNIDPLTGEIRFVVNPDFEMPSDSDSDRVYQFSVLVSDGGGLSVTQPISITVLPINDNAPSFTSPPLITIDENDTFVTFLSAFDLDLPSQTVTYAITGGADQDLFGIDVSTGRLYFLSAPDFENPLDADNDQNYELVVSVQDGQGLSADQALTVQVLPVNDNSPIFVSTNSIEVNENVSLVGVISATDADLPSGILDYSIVGGADSGRFNIDPVTGSLSFLVAPNFEQPVDVGLDNVYEVTISADDGLGRSTTLPIQITVLNCDEGLAIYLPSSPPTFNRTGPVTLDPAAYIEDPDTEIPDLRNRTLTITLNSPDANDEIYVATQGNGPGRVSVLFGNIVYESSLVIIGTTNGTDARGQLIIRFTSFATPAAVNALLRAISFRSTSESQTSGQRNVMFEISDEAGPGTVTNSKPVDVVPVPASVPLHSELAESVLSQTFTANNSSEFQGGRLNVDFGRNFSRKDRLTLRSDLGITVRGKDISYQGQKIGRIVRKGKSLQVDFSSSAARGTAVKAVIESVALKASRGRTAAQLAECDFRVTQQRDGVETLFSRFSFSIPSA